jgi:hypothetical protein
VGALLAACSVPPHAKMPDAGPHDAAPADALPPLPACTAPGTATYTFDPTTVISPQLPGFGAQFNGNAYSDLSMQAGITPANVGDMETKALALQPRHVRIFWSSTATPDEVASVERVVDLAERAGATINITYWHGPYPDPAGQMQAFEQELAHLIGDLHHDAVRYVTIQNEVNSTMVTMAAYEQLYRTLDADLRSAGLRDHIKFVCGDLLRTNQAAWFAYLAQNMTDVCDGYSVHIYWQYNDTAYMITRLTEVHDIVAGLPAAGQKPLYVTEFGVRGDPSPGIPDPGVYSDGTEIERTNENAFQHAWFSVLATRLGYVSTLKWDAFFAKYDSGTQYYSMIGIPPDYFVKPVYYETQLFTKTVPAGWSSVNVSGPADTRLVAGYTGPLGHATVIALNRASTATMFDVTGLPPGTPVRVVVWHGESDGTLTTTQDMTSSDCKVSFSVPARSVAAVTTLAVP